MRVFKQTNFSLPVILVFTLFLSFFCIAYADNNYKTYSTLNLPNSNSVNLEFKIPSTWLLTKDDRSNSVFDFEIPTDEQMIYLSSTLMTKNTLSELQNTSNFHDYFKKHISEFTAEGNIVDSLIETIYDANVPGVVVISRKYSNIAGINMCMYSYSNILDYDGKLIIFQCNVGGPKIAEGKVKKAYSENIVDFMKLGMTFYFPDKWHGKNSIMNQNSGLSKKEYISKCVYNRSLAFPLFLILFPFSLLLFKPRKKAINMDLITLNSNLNNISKYCYFEGFLTLLITAVLYDYNGILSTGLGLLNGIIFIYIGSKVNNYSEQTKKTLQLGILNFLLCTIVSSFAQQYVGYDKNHYVYPISNLTTFIIAINTSLIMGALIILYQRAIFLVSSYSKHLTILNNSDI